jgi:sugar transferase EpsL
MIKRIFDIMGSSCALFFFSPFILFLAILIRWNIGSPVLFVQMRPGKEGKLFKFYKFRTMTNLTDENGVMLPDAARVTKIGKLLRQASMDELLSFWNVLKGDMSIVGPRPLLLEYLPLYSPEQFRRHEVKPGITGWAQINGRNAISWEEKFQYDVWYIDHHSCILDIKIILLTIFKVLKKENINSSSNISMEKFEGSKQQ